MKTDTVARLGGDEFAIVQSSFNHPEDATALADRLLHELSADPYAVAGHRVVIGASVGIASAPEDGNDPDKLLKSADMALYRAKEDGRGNYRFFEPGMDARAQARRLMETELRLALARDEFEVYYQPIKNLESDRIIAFEALVRWKSSLARDDPAKELYPAGGRNRLDRRGRGLGAATGLLGCRRLVQGCLRGGQFVACAIQKILISWHPSSRR